MRVLAFVHKAPGISPGQRFRIEQWAPHLAKDHGIDVDFAPFDSPELTQVLYQPGHFAKKGALMLGAVARRQRDVRRARHYDAAYVYREVASLGPAVYERILHRVGVPYVLDFDDAIWMSGGANKVNGLFSKLRFPQKTATAARHARAVTVGNAYLADWARQHNDAVYIVPTTIDLPRYAIQPPREPDGLFRIVWMGSFSTLKYLELIRAPIEKLGTERPVELRVVCDRPLDRPFAGITNTFVKWTAENEARDIGAGDVGVMPLDDTPWARGKCGCKALQYMAAGRPAIAAPVGVNRDIVSHGENGLLATTDGEWLHSLRTLADDPDYREALARRGRVTVESHFSSVVGAEGLAVALRHATRSTPTPIA